MAIYTGDQQTTSVLVINGVHASVTGAVLKAASPANTTYKFTDNYTFHYGNSPLSFRPNVAYVLDPALKAALLAASAPMVAL
jgi:hypothetical protein